MWTVEYRAITPEERAELRGLLGKCPGPAREAAGFLVGALALLALSQALPSTLGLTCLSMLAGGLLGAWSQRRRADRAMRDALRRDLRHGKVQVFHVSPRQAVRLNGPGDIPAGYFVEIGDGQVMFVEPRDWEEAAGPDFERLFPCCRFSLVRAPLSNVDLDFLCEGDYFPPAREIDLASPDSLRRWVTDGEILPGPLETLEEELELAGCHR